MRDLPIVLYLLGSLLEFWGFTLYFLLPFDPKWREKRWIAWISWIGGVVL